VENHTDSHSVTFEADTNSAGYTLRILLRWSALLLEDSNTTSTNIREV